MNKIMQRNTRRSNKANLDWDPNNANLIWGPDDDDLEHDRASPLMLDAGTVGRVVPRVKGGYQVLLNRGVVLDRKSTDYRIHPGDGVTDGLWFDLPRDALPRGKAKGDTRRSINPTTAGTWRMTSWNRIGPHR